MGAFGRSLMTGLLLAAVMVAAPLRAGDGEDDDSPVVVDKPRPAGDKSLAGDKDKVVWEKDKPVKKYVSGDTVSVMTPEDYALALKKKAAASGYSLVDPTTGGPYTDGKKLTVDGQPVTAPSDGLPYDKKLYPGSGQSGVDPLSGATVKPGLGAPTGAGGADLLAGQPASTAEVTKKFGEQVAQQQQQQQQQAAARGEAVPTHQNPTSPGGQAPGEAGAEPRVVTVDATRPGARTPQGAPVDDSYRPIPLQSVAQGDATQGGPASRAAVAAVPPVAPELRSQLISAQPGPYAAVSTASTVFSTDKGAAEPAKASADPGSPVLAGATYSGWGTQPGAAPASAPAARDLLAGAERALSTGNSDDIASAAKALVASPGVLTTGQQLVLGDALQKAAAAQVADTGAGRALAAIGLAAAPAAAPVGAQVSTSAKNDLVARVAGPSLGAGAPGAGAPQAPVSREAALANANLVAVMRDILPREADGAAPLSRLLGEARGFTGPRGGMARAETAGPQVSGALAASRPVPMAAGHAGSGAASRGFAMFSGKTSAGHGNAGTAPAASATLGARGLRGARGIASAFSRAIGSASHFEGRGARGRITVAGVSTSKPFAVAFGLFSALTYAAAIPGYLLRRRRRKPGASAPSAERVSFLARPVRLFRATQKRRLVLAGAVGTIALAAIPRLVSGPSGGQAKLLEGISATAAPSGLVAARVLPAATGATIAAAVSLPQAATGFRPEPKLTTLSPKPASPAAPTKKAAAGEQDGEGAVEDRLSASAAPASPPTAAATATMADGGTMVEGGTIWNLARWSQAVVKDLAAKILAGLKPMRSAPSKAVAHAGKPAASSSLAGRFALPTALASLIPRERDVVRAPASEGIAAAESESAEDVASDSEMIYLAMIVSLAANCALIAGVIWFLRRRKLAGRIDLIGGKQP